MFATGSQNFTLQSSVVEQNLIGRFLKACKTTHARAVRIYYTGLNIK